MRRVALFVLLTVAAVALPGCAARSASPRAGHPHSGHHHDATISHSFSDVERWVAVFDDPARDAWQRPEEVVRFLGVGEAQVVADLGAGTGYFTVRLARAVGSSGKVYAVEIAPAMVDHLRRRAGSEGLPQVVPILADPDDPKLPAGELDLVLIVDTWHHIDDRTEYLTGLARTLKSGGRVAVVDFHEGELPVGPPPGHKLSREAVIREFEEAGWGLVAESTALPYQYLLVFRPRAS